MFYRNATKFIGSFPYPNLEGYNPRTLYLNHKKECIPVGCVPSTAVAVCRGMSSQGVCLPARGCLPKGVSAHGGVCLGVSAWGVCLGLSACLPGGFCPGGCACPGVSAHRGVCPGGCLPDTLPPVDRMT